MRQQLFARQTCLILLLAWVGLSTTANANEPTPIKATIVSQGSGFYTISVSVRHGDEGWDHYADRWEVIDSEGNVLATRLLQHPHVDEQPFTRSLSALRLPPTLDAVIIRVHDSKHGYGRRKIKLERP
ncbi:hypothetical protein [Aestuariirhabdus sp. LZHN29]|uniref:hypothetical protein n=1 Tax=Aestuariirhabdus sp. LZHN29 TaxID=3417462 RepID=UPI003CEB86B9